MSPEDSTMTIVVTDHAAWIDCGCGCRLRGVFPDTSQELRMTCVCGSVWTAQRKDGQIVVSKWTEERARLVPP